MIPVDNAVNIILDSVTPLKDEIVDIFNSPGRVIYDDIISDINIPPFNNSAMDGYAVVSSDTKNASKESPVKLKITGEIQAGSFERRSQLKPGSALTIMTGAVMPEGADSVIPVEYTREEKGYVYIFKELKIDENVRFAGEDISSGQVVLKKGTLIKSADAGLLASLNMKNIRVYKKPKVAIISTGDEVVDVGEEIRPGQIRNSNAYTLYSEIRKYGAEPYYMGIAKDTPGDTKEKFSGALDSDIIITTGGVSMGKYDFVKDTMRELGIEVKIEKIRIKPGKPMVFGVKGEKLFFGLPGNPVSTMTSFIQFVRPAILRMMGAQKTEKPLVNAVLENDLRKKSGRLNLIRGYFFIRDGKFHVSTTGPQGSGILSSMSSANCLIILPENIETVKKGEEVSILLINHEEI